VVLPARDLDEPIFIPAVSATPRDMSMNPGNDSGAPSAARLPLIALQEIVLATVCPYGAERSRPPGAALQHEHGLLSAMILEVRAMGGRSSCRQNRCRSRQRVVRPALAP